MRWKQNLDGKRRNTPKKEKVKKIKNKKGKTEVRSIIDRGMFVRYEYLDPSTGEKTENKIKIVLKTEKGTDEYFIIPMKDKRNLMLPVESKGPRKLWDGNRNQAVDL
jgi:hypothetical protein